MPAPLPTSQALIRSLVYAPLGAPLLPTELDISVEDEQLALSKYYSYVPIKVVRNYPSATSGYSFSQQMAELVPSADYHYMGVVSFAMRAQLNAARVDEYLLGNGYLAPHVPLDQQAYHNTMMDLQTGDPYYVENFVEEKVDWTVGQRGTLSVVYGIGHNGLDKVPRRHIELMAALVGVAYYTRILAIRKTGAFNGADFTLDGSVLQNALEQAQLRSDDTLAAIGLVPATLG
jgi:hypothetical protein